MNLNRDQMHTAGKPFLGEMERHQIGGRSLQFAVVCEPAQRRGQSICTMHSTSLPQFVFSKNRYFCRPVLIRASACFVLARGLKGSHINHITKSKELHPSPSECVWNVVSESSESPRGSGTEPTESGEKLIRPLYPFPRE